MKPIIGITANFIKDGRFGVDAHIGGAGQFGRRWQMTTSGRWSWREGPQ